MTERLIQVKAGPGGDDPFNYVMLSGLQVFRGDWAAAGINAEGPGGVRARGGRRLPVLARCVASPSWRPTTAGWTRPDGWRRRGLHRRSSGGPGPPGLPPPHPRVRRLVAGRPPDRRRGADPRRDPGRQSGTRHPGRFKVDGDRFEAAIGAGDLDRARDVVGFLEHVARVAPTPWTLAIGAGGEGSSTRRRAISTPPSRRWIRALVEHERLPMPFERGRTLLAKGQVHRRRKEKRLADAVLHEALAIFVSLGAPLWLGTAGPSSPASGSGRERHRSDRHRTTRGRVRGDGPVEPPDRGAGVPRTQDGRQRARPRLRETRDPLASRARSADGGGELGGRGAAGTDRVIAPFIAPDASRTVHAMDRSRHHAAYPDVPGRTVWPGSTSPWLGPFSRSSNERPRAMTREGTPVEHVV